MYSVFSFLILRLLYYRHLGVYLSHFFWVLCSSLRNIWYRLNQNRRCKRFSEKLFATETYLGCVSAAWLSCCSFSSCFVRIKTFFWVHCTLPAAQQLFCPVQCWFSAQFTISTNFCLTGLVSCFWIFVSLTLVYFLVQYCCALCFHISAALKSVDILLPKPLYFLYDQNYLNDLLINTFGQRLLWWCCLCQQ